MVGATRSLQEKTAELLVYILQLVVGCTNVWKFYPVQITGRNNSVNFDYPPWLTVGDYKWHPDSIMVNSKQCAEKRNQDWALKGDAYPQISSNILDQTNALTFVNKVDIDSTECLWNLPILEFSDGPEPNGANKLHDTIQDFLVTLTYFMGTGDDYSPRHKWKENAPRDE